MPQLSGLLYKGKKAGPLIQPKLTINTPGDVYEQEADAMADRVMRMPMRVSETKPVNGLIGRSVQRKCASCEEEEKKKSIMRKELGDSGELSVSSSFSSSLNASKGGGSPLPLGTRSFMENAFSTDFSKVRVHSDNNASEMSKSINARAFTTGSDIYFSHWEYKPETTEGRHLLAHELTHVVQKSSLIQRSTPAVQDKTAPQSFSIANKGKEGDKKFALKMGQDDADRIRKVGEVSLEYRQELNAKLRFFIGGAKDIYIQQIKPAIFSIIPSKDVLSDFCRNSISDVWTAQNQGLNDFESQLKDDMDWSALVLNLVGNLTWATAAFATGGTAFIISLAGIGLATAGSGLTNVSDQKSFHTFARNQIDTLKTFLDNRISDLTNQAYEEEFEHLWNGNKVRKKLLHRLLKPNFTQTAMGGVPVIDSAAIAATMEKDLLFRAATTPWETWSGWKHGDAWLEFNYTIDNTIANLTPTAPSQWKKPDISWIYIFPLGMSELPDLNNRINVLYDKTLKQPKDTKLWPIRKTLRVLLRYAGQVTIELGEHNEYHGWFTSIDDRIIKKYLQAAGTDVASKDMFQKFLLNQLWAESNGVPPVIEKLFIGK